MARDFTESLLQLVLILLGTVMVVAVITVGIPRMVQELSQNVNMAAHPTPEHTSPPQPISH